MKYAFAIIAVILAIVVVFFLNYTKILERNFSIPNSSNSLNTTKTTPSPDSPALLTIAENLNVPWSIDFLPNGNIIFTQRPGTVSLIENSKVIDIANIDVKNQGEGGLLGIAIDPEFETNNFAYLYFTYGTSGQNTLNRVVRYKLENNKLTENKILVDKIPGASNHNGGRIKFGPDGYLYITTGDAQEPTQSQNKNSLAGKILRIDRNGETPADNPFGSKVYSFGHRNPQGLSWDSNNQLWSTEHGRSGASSGLDEVNLIKPGNNYGWPDIQGDETRNGMQTPIINSGATNTWAPGGGVFIGNTLYFTGLRGTSIYSYNADTKELKQFYNGTFGRIRDIVLGPDGFLYISTSNKDGRGVPLANDDKIIKINPSKIGEE